MIKLKKLLEYAPLLIPIIFILIIGFIILSVFNIARADPVIILKDGNTFTRTYTCKITEGLEAGNKVKKEIAGWFVYIQKMKSNTFIPLGEILPIQTAEDSNSDGNTDYVTVRVDTWERIAKEKPIKATDSVFVEDSEYTE